MRTYRFVLLLIIAGIGISIQQNTDNPVIDKNKLLERHNFYRMQLGVPNLKWSDELTEAAQKWANRLAKRCEMKHSTGDLGENIYWCSDESTAAEVVDFWAKEEKYFNHRNTTYKISNGHKSGHYSQMIWSETTHVGGAMQKCVHGGEIWVCNYSPHGNIVGRKAY